MKSKWNELARTVNNARAKSAVAKTLLPSLPYLAEGGWIKKNTPMLAVVGDNKSEGEVVAPESKLQAMAMQAASAGNQQVIALLQAILATVSNMDTGVYLDGQEIKNNVVRRINQHTISTGQLELII